MTVQSTTASNVARGNILDLPNDILVNIFDYLRHEVVDDYGRYSPFGTFDRAKDDLQDLRNVRLVCRIFHQLASQHLYPVLRLPLERTSLDKIDAILNNPRILEGVRVIQVVLHYRPKDIAQSLRLFQHHRLTELGEMYQRCCYYEETWYLGGHDYDDETICDLPHRVYCEAIDNYSAISRAWLVESDPDHGEVDGEVDGEKDSEYRSILQQGHEEYRKKYEEQYRLITDGSFAEAVSKLVSHAPRSTWLEFIDEMPYPLGRYDLDPTQILNDTERLSHYMSTPHKWSTMEALGSEADLAPMELLATLPIAIYQQGTMLQGVKYSCFPLVDGHYGICGQSDHALWDDLNVSCKNIRTFSWGMGGSLNHKSIRHNPPQGEDRACLDRFFGAMLSSSRLEFIYLNFHSFGLADGRGDHSLVGKNLEFELTNVLGVTPYPYLKQVQIGGMSIPQVNLERFIEGLGEELQSFYIYSVELDGNWAGIMDLLREKYSQHSLEGRCKVNFTSLWGGEFGMKEPEEDEMDFLASLYKIPPEPVLITQSLQYVKGDPQMTENPLR